MDQDNQQVLRELVDGLKDVQRVQRVISKRQARLQRDIRVLKEQVLEINIAMKGTTHNPDAGLLSRVRKMEATQETQEELNNQINLGINFTRYLAPVIAVLLSVSLNAIGWYYTYRMTMEVVQSPAFREKVREIIQETPKPHNR